MMEWLLDLKDNIDRHGIRWGLILTLYAVFRKERRNYRLDQRDAAIFHNQKVIMDLLGVGDQWHGQVKISCWDQPNYKQLYSSLRKETILNQRRLKKMNNQSINYMTLIPTILGAAKLILQTFGIDIPDETLNEVVNGAAAVGTIIGIFLAHKKGVSNVKLTIDGSTDK